jgi:hypothetical protein
VPRGRWRLEIRAQNWRRDRGTATSDLSLVHSASLRPIRGKSKFPCRRQCLYIRPVPIRGGWKTRDRSNREAKRCGCRGDGGGSKFRAQNWRRDRGVATSGLSLIHSKPETRLGVFPAENGKEGTGRIGKGSAAGVTGRIKNGDRSNVAGAERGGKQGTGQIVKEALLVPRDGGGSKFALNECYIWPVPSPFTPSPLATS